MPFRPARTLLAIVAAAAAAPAASHAASVTLTDSVQQSGFNGGTPSSFPLTPDGSFVEEVSPFDFTDQDYQSLESIEFISISLHLGSGDSLPGEVNFDEFTLALDGFDTGLTLNGDWVVVENGTVFVTETFTGPILNSASILAALLADGQLAATILDSDPGDDFVSLGSSNGGSAYTTLVINGLAGPGNGGGNGGGDGPGEHPGQSIPTPTAAGAGLASLFALVIRRRKA